MLVNMARAVHKDRALCGRGLRGECQVDQRAISMASRRGPAALAARPAYRPDIDGLRAVSILAVVMFHAFPNEVRGGFVGVDVFFVISGFLISAILFRGLVRGDFSFKSFYAHRVNRIFPSLVVVMAASFALGWFTLLPEDFKRLGKHLAAGAGFAQNIVLWKEDGYFDAASESKPLMHLWSLAVEEQFYLLYPLLIWAAWRMRLNVFLVLMLLFLVSFGLNVDTVKADPTKAFFHPQTRFWELLAGALLAYFHVFWRPVLAAVRRLESSGSAVPFGIRFGNVSSAVGLGLIVFAVFGFDEGRSFPGWRALAPVVGAFLVIGAGPDAWVNQKLLSNRAMVFIGLVSYPLYLWHWPIFSYLMIIDHQGFSGMRRVVALVASFTLAWATYRFIEKPVRFGKGGGSKTVWLVLLVMLIAGAGCYVFVRNGFPSRMHLAMTEQELLEERARYWNNSKQIGADFSENKINVIVYGDSQAHDILHALQNDDRIGLKFFEASHGCSAFFSADIGSDEADERKCRKSFDAMLDSEHARGADVLIYAHQWRPGSEIEANYRIGVDAIRKVNAGVEIYFFGPKHYLSPTGSINSIMRGYTSSWGVNEYLASKVVADRDDVYAAELARKNGTVFVDVRKIFCLDGCLFYGADGYAYFDSNHWSQVGADRFYARLAKTDWYRAMLRRQK